VLRTLDFDRSWVSAEGAELIDARGDRYLDLLGGYGVFALGRNNPRVRDALAQTLAAGTANLPQLGVTLPAGLLAEELLARMPARIDAAVLSNAGTEAIEAALKLARMATGRPRVLFCERGFHGLTLGALSVNGNPEYRERAGALLPGCEAVPFGDLDALARELARGDVAAFLVEPVQGKGVHVAPPGYLPDAQELCRRHGTLLALDEIQTGLGRTGRPFAFEHWDLEPDIVTVAKAATSRSAPRSPAARCSSECSTRWSARSCTARPSPGTISPPSPASRPWRSSTAPASSSARARTGSGCWSSLARSWSATRSCARYAGWG
jgi:ornithine--oxo-acid transaminase